MPGYVCRYDDYEELDYEESFAPIVADMNAARAESHSNGNGNGVRSHGPHHQQRGAHAVPAQEQVAAHDDRREFGSGIL